MVVVSTLRAASVLLALAAFSGVEGQSLNPQQDIVLPSSSSASNPLQWLGANGPWIAGPNVHGVSNVVPDQCTVEQVSYTVRHGSRYPDSGAYNEWVALYDKIQAANFKATGSLKFVKDWKPVLTNPSVQISMESITGYKESHDLGYTMRTRYPDLYTEGSPFIVWANLYVRVVQTARMFVRGFLGANSVTLGKVYSVDSTNYPASLGNNLSPSDLCPNFQDVSGGDYVTQWDAVYLPPITKRLNKLLSGNLIFTTDDVSIMPYLCGFESQIVGELSSWCSVFTDEELKNYEYRQDLRYYYGVGPGTNIPSKMMIPFLHNIVDLLAQGPGVQGKDASGANFTVPSIIMTFANDGQINELATATGVFDDQTAFSGTSRPSTSNWKYLASRISPMRGTVAFERLNCVVKGRSSNPKVTSQSQTTHNETYIRVLLNDAVYPAPTCQSGPGKSCALATYQTLVNNKYDQTKDWKVLCNATNEASPSVAAGASFITDLSLPWLASVTP